MKRVICAKDMEEVLYKDEKVLYTSKDYILTPSAIDLAKENNIKIVEDSEREKKEFKSIENINANELIELLKAMMQEGALQELIKKLLEQKNEKYEAESDGSGFKVIRGNTVKMDVFDTGNPNAKVYFQELINKDESKMSAGFLTIENSSFDWELTYEEIDYVIEGTLTMEINGKKYEAYPGDVVFVPSESKVKWGSPNKAKICYVTYPANWADLI